MVWYLISMPLIAALDPKVGLVDYSDIFEVISSIKKWIKS